MGIGPRRKGIPFLPPEEAWGTWVVKTFPGKGNLLNLKETWSRKRGPGDSHPGVPGDAALTRTRWERTLTRGRENFRGKIFNQGLKARTILSGGAAVILRGRL